MEAVKILAIESSCDETSASVLDSGSILSNVTYTQAIHEKYGGVIPESASRLHLKNILPVVEEALQQSGIEKGSLDAIAFTQSPGLIGSLLVGSCFAKSFAQALGLPIIGVNHMEAHVISNLISDPKPEFPFLCLTVSGGHTQIIVCHSPLHQELLGQTIDDAAGETFDKAAKMLGLPYPGGPLVDKYAAAGEPRKFKFAEPQVPGLNFSFSGLKTSILYFIQAQVKIDPDFISKNLNDLCASIQYTIIQILMKKLVVASKQTGIREVCIAGGVSANKGLRKALADQGRLHGWKTYIPAFEYCTDNAAMIALTAYYKYLAGNFAKFDEVASARS